MTQELKKENSLVWKDNKIVYMDRQIYIPNNKKLWEQILQENHNPMNASYLEQQIMLKLIMLQLMPPKCSIDLGQE